MKVEVVVLGSPRRWKNVRGRWVVVVVGVVVVVVAERRRLPMTEVHYPLSTA